MLQKTRLAMGPCVVLLLLAAVAPVDAAGPRGASKITGPLTLEADRQFGYRMLRPAGWTRTNEATPMGRAYRSPVTAGGAQVILSAINLKVAAQALGPTATIAQWAAFGANSTLSGWTRNIERGGRHNAIGFTLLHQLPNAKVYALRAPGRANVVLAAYVIDRGEPLVIGLSGAATSPSLGSLARVRADRLLEDFMTIVKSVRAIPADPLTGGTFRTEASSPEKVTGIARPLITGSSRIMTLSVDSGPWYGDSGYRYVGFFTYRLKDVYYQAPPKVANLYEYMYYSQYTQFEAWLYRTNVTDYPSTTCSEGGGLLEHPIAKHTTATSGTLTDDWWPYKYVAHLNPTTAHMMVFGPPGVVYCKWYFPYVN